MFDASDLKCLDPKYFLIINVNEYDVTVMSRNTGHYWYLHNPEYPEKGTVVIFHKHRASHHTTTTAGRIPCGRRCEASGDMIGGR